MESFFEFLFKYRPALFQQGDVVLRAPWPLGSLLVAAIVVAVVVGLSYLRPGGRASALDRGVMAALRTGALSVVVLCLLQPTLVLRSVVPQRNFVAVLIDDSRSMALPDEDGAPRSDFVGARLTPDGDLMRRLSERFTVRTFGFSSGTDRITDVGALAYDGTRTDLAAALTGAREALSSVPLSGIVVVSDGADNGGRPLTEAIVPLQAASIPVFTVGLGAEAITPDIQLDRVQAPRRVLVGSAVVVDVVIGQRGYAGRTVTLEVEDDGNILARQDIELGEDGEPVVARVRFIADRPGPRRLVFRVPAAEGETVGGNNTREVPLDVREEREKILYFEGEPRFEVKFMRRAVEDDPNLQVVVLQRTAEDKYLRLDVDGPDELPGGFPRTREELFRYQGLILGSVEAGYFTHDQLLMIQDFASQRGGGLLVLGGRHAFAEGGYVGTPVADALPVMIEEDAPLSGQAVAVKVHPTQAGALHPATQIAGPDEDPAAAWDRLPEVTSLNPIVAVKPGATTLLAGSPGEGQPERVVLAWHRFGRGRVMALAIQDSWLWQMHADVPLEDQSHERFWQQLLRGLVDGVAQPVEATLERDRVESGEPVRVTARVRDSIYIALNDARVSARLVAPSGAEREVPLDWSVEDDGLYTGSFIPDENGIWRVGLEATRNGTEAGADETWLRVGPGDDEFFDAGRRASLLERIAEDTGGRSYTAADVDDLPEDLQYAGAGITLTEDRDLWDMPVFFFLLLGLIGSEWALRRRRGLV